MTVETASPATLFVSVRDLADRWGVHPRTARQRTRQEGFPEMYELGPRSQRWVLAEVDRWEKGTRRRARHQMTGLPQHRGITIRAGVILKRRAA